jgi:serine/threonine protein kinase
MGEVYRARDSRLKRDVALKLLPASFTTDPDRLARFQREAELLAALNHPHIAHIHGVEDSGPARALVLEFVDGVTLADRIAQGPIPLDEAWPIASQIAEALEAAHECGIVHRDLKPANIKVRPDGAVKVLDFGLAKAVGSDVEMRGLADSPTITAVGTRAGIILGTAPYMSPEQAKGRPVDRRTDIWAFGVVLYEVLTGTAAFQGNSVAETLSQILTQAPNWELLPADTPPSIHKLLRRCLEKNPARRLDSAAAVRLEIDEALTPPAPVTTAGGGKRPRRVTREAIVALAAGSLLAALGMWFVTRNGPQPPCRASLPGARHSSRPTADGSGSSTGAI